MFMSAMAVVRPIVGGRHRPFAIATRGRNAPLLALLRALRSYGASFDRTSVCYDASASLLLCTVDSCPCNYPTNWCARGGGGCKWVRQVCAKRW